MRYMNLWWLVAALAACDGGGGAADAGRDSGALGDATAGDAGSDAGIGDGGTDGGADAGPACACDGDQACVRGVCVATCAADVSGFDAALGDGVTPIRNICRARAARSTRVEGSSVEVFDLTTEEEGALVHLIVSTWSLTDTTPVELGRATYDRGTSTDTIFTGGYVAPSADGARALVGLTTSGAGFPGRVFAVSSAGGSAFDAPGNFDAEHDGDRALIDALGVEGNGSGHGLYAVSTGGAPSPRTVATELGDYSASIAVTDDFVLAGGVSDFGTMWPDGSTGGRVFVLARARVEAAITSGTPIAAFSDTSIQRFDDLATTFTRVGEAIVTYDYDSLRRYELTFDGTTLTLSTPRTLAQGAVFSEALDAGTGRVLLAHASGLLLVEL